MAVLKYHSLMNIFQWYIHISNFHELGLQWWKCGSIFDISMEYSFHCYSRSLPTLWYCYDVHVGWSFMTGRVGSHMSASVAKLTQNCWVYRRLGMSPCSMVNGMEEQLVAVSTTKIHSSIIHRYNTLISVINKIIITVCTQIAIQNPSTNSAHIHIADIIQHEYIGYLYIVWFIILDTVCLHHSPRWDRGDA